MYPGARGAYPCPDCKGSGYKFLPVKVTPPEPVKAPLTLLERTIGIIEELARDSWKEGTKPYWDAREEAEKIVAELRTQPVSALEFKPVVYRRRGESK